MCVGGIMGGKQSTIQPFQSSQSALNAQQRESQDAEQQAIAIENREAQYELKKNALRGTGRSSLLTGKAGGRGFETDNSNKAGKKYLGV